MKPTLSEQIRCVEREIRMRNRVYPGLVDRRKMSPQECEREMLTMAAVLETLKAAEQLAGCLEEAPRVDYAGHPVSIADDPEGKVVIYMTHTLATGIAARLRGGGP